MATTFYLAQKLLNHVLHGPNTANPGEAYAQPLNVYVGLFTSMPSVDASSNAGSEVDGVGYTRLPVNFTYASTNNISNNSDLSFDICGSSWGTIVGFGIFDEKTNGNLLYFTQLTAPKSIFIGDIIKFPLGTLIITCN